MFRRNQSDEDRQAEIQRHAQSILTLMAPLAEAIAADQPSDVVQSLKQIELAGLSIPKHYRWDVASLLAKHPFAQYTTGAVEIYERFNQMVISNEHEHLHGRDRRPDRA